MTLHMLTATYANDFKSIYVRGHQADIDTILPFQKAKYSTALMGEASHFECFS